MNIQSLNKKIIMLLIFGLLLTTPGIALAGSNAGPTLAATNQLVPMFAAGTATINSGALNVRSGPGVGYGSVAVVYKNQSVNLLGRNADGSWAKIQLANGVEGWVNATLIIPSVAISTLPVLTQTGNAHVATGNLNVRSGPAVTYPSIAVAGNGDSLVLLGRNSNSSWVKVRLANAKEGWVNATLISTSTSISSLPVLDGGTGGNPSSEPTATVATGALNIRSGPGANNTVVATLSNGQPLALLGRTENSGWAKVRVYNGTVGWANAAYLNLSVPFSSLPVVGAGSPAPNPGPSAATGTVTANALNVRSGPGVGYWVVTGIYSGQHVNVHGRSADNAWLKISVGNVTGWASSTFIRTNVPIASLTILYS